MPAYNTWRCLLSGPKPAGRIEKLVYSIRELAPLARELEKKGEKVLYFNIGDPVRWGFQPPVHVRRALCEAVEEGYSWYSSSQGDEELREAIAEKEWAWNRVKISPDDVFLAFGVTEAILLVFASLLDRGDEVLLPNPTYPLYTTYAHFLETKTVYYKCAEDNEWQPSLEDIESKITDRTKAIVVINPNNPTGATYSAETLKRIAELAAEHNIALISDEIYDGLVLEGEHVSAARVAPKDATIIGLNGFSKNFLMTGWRLGYMYVKGDERVKEAICKTARSRLGVCTPIQRAAIAALRGPLTHLEKFKRELIKRRNLMSKLLAESGFFSLVKPKATFYVFPRLNFRGPWRSEKEMVKELLVEEKVYVVHGSGFGPGGEWHMRLVFLPPPDVIEEGVGRIVRFLERHVSR